MQKKKRINIWSNEDSELEADRKACYEELVGPVPDGMKLKAREVCPVNCINPEHQIFISIKYKY